MITDSILNEINENEKLIKAQTSRFESFEENLRSIEKTRKRIASANTNLTTKQNDEVNNFFSQQFRNAETMMLCFYNLQRARFLKQQS